MFDTLTDDERHALYGKVGDWAHKFAEIGLPLSKVALANYVTDPDTTTVLWAQRERYYDAMNELHDLMSELAA